MLKQYHFNKHQAKSEKNCLKISQTLLKLLYDKNYSISNIIVINEKIYLFIDRKINQNKMQGKLVFIHSKDKDVQNSVFTKSIELSIRKKAQKNCGQLYSQNQKCGMGFGKLSKCINQHRVVRRLVGNFNNQVEQGNRRLFNDIKNIQSIQSLLAQKQQTHDSNNPFQKPNTQDNSVINSYYPTFFPQNLNLESKNRYCEWENEESIQAVYHRKMANKIRKFSNSENCFYSITQQKPDLNINKKGKIIRGIQSAKKSRSFSKSGTQKNKQPIQSQQSTLINFRENKVHIKPRNHQKRNKLNSADFMLSNQIVQDFFKSGKNKQSLNEPLLNEKQRVIRKIEQQKNINPRKISASRALQYFSQVFKRQDIERIKIRKGSIGQSQDICTKKVVLQERLQNREQSKEAKFKGHISAAKQDKENIGFPSDFEKGLSWKKRTRKQKINRDQNFDIIGWQVPEMF